MALTIVSYPPTLAPAVWGEDLPSRITATSVVVPPISAMTPSVIPLRPRAPIALAAGPERIVSIGRDFTNSADTSDPSPLITINRLWIPSLVMAVSTARIRSRTKGTKRAFNSAVTERLAASS